MAWGYVRMYVLTGDCKYRALADRCLKWLIENRSTGYSGYCWGNHFPFTTRAGTIPCQTPTLVWSSLIGLAFLEAYEIFGDSRYLDVAVSTSDWVKSLPREKTDCGICLSYVPLRQSSIHNSNMLGAALLARVASQTQDRGSFALAKEAMRYSCSRQRFDGAWFYGDSPRYQWIDNFHTGYNLDCLKRYIDCTGDHEFEPNLHAGFHYFKSHFFEDDGRPRYYHDRAYPTDIQCAAQSIDTLAFFSQIDGESLGMASKVACWTINNMQAQDGHFYYRDLGWKKVKTPMLHWGQATMFKALVHLLTRVTEDKRSTERADEVLARSKPN